MTDPTPAAGGLSDAEVEFVYDWTPDDPGKRREMAEELSRIIAARTEAADREVARVMAAVEALADGPHTLINDCGMAVRWVDPAELRAALSSADIGALDRERAKARAEGKAEGVAETTAYLSRVYDNACAAAVSPEGGDE